MDIKETLMENTVQLEKERRELDRLAEESLKAGKNLGQVQEVIAQSRVVETLVLKEMELRKMLEEIPEEREQ